MAQFRGTIQNGIHSTSRLGSKKSGLSVMLNGWDIGVTCHIQHNTETGKDEISVLKTGGSNVGQKAKVISEFSEK